MQTSGHVDNDLQISALDAFYEKDGRKSRYIKEVVEWYRGEDAGDLKRSELNYLVENLTCLNVLEVKFWKSDQKVVMDDKMNQKVVMDEELVQNDVMDEELVQNDVMDEKLVQNGVMDGRFVKNFVMNAKFYPKVVMDLSIFKIGECASFAVLLPIDPSKNSPSNCHFVFQSSLEFPDLGTQISGTVQLDPLRKTPLLQRSMLSSSEALIQISQCGYRSEPPIPSCPSSRLGSQQNRCPRRL